MRITVKAGGLFTRKLPGGENPAEIALPEAASVADALAALGIEAEVNALVSLNGTAVRPAERAARHLAEGDRLALMPPLRGG